MSTTDFRWDPKITITEKKEDFMSFELENVDSNIANSLRRIMIAEIPTLCIDKVSFHDNTSSMQDEYIAHRVGLIPLRSRLHMRDWKYQHECQCESSECNSCTVRLTLNCSYDDLRREYHDSTSISIPVTSRHLTCHHRDVDVVHFSSREEADRSFDDGIVIMHLSPGQSLHFDAIAVKGIAKEHAKWSPVSTVAMKYDPIITLDDACLNQYSEKQREELVMVCPTRVFDLDDNNRVVLQRPSDCMFCRECTYLLEDFRRLPEDGLGITVQHSNNHFYFSVETTGALTAEEVVKESLIRLKEKVKFIVSQVKLLPR